jgi:hypothetical protein
MRQNFIVYAHVRPDTGKIFYVGKGTLKRLKHRANRNPHWHNIVNKCGGFDAIILHDGLTEPEAFRLEIDQIKTLRLSGAELCNMTDGGDGISGFKFSDETKLKMSLTRKGRPAPNKGKRASAEARENMRRAAIGKVFSDEHRARLRKKRTQPVSKETRDRISKALTGKSLSSEHVAKMSKKIVCLDTGVIYKSVRDASLSLGVWPASVSRVCRGQLGQTGGYRFAFIDNNQQVTT